jgi:vancomycin resistance protein YoaR
MVLAALVVSGAFVHTAYQRRALPGVRLGDLRLSGLTESEIKDLLDLSAQPLLAAPVTFFFGPREWRPPAPEMGLTINTAEMARQALALGRSGPAVLRGAEALLTALRRPEVELRAHVDEAQAAAFLGAVALEVDRAAVDAALAVRNGQLVVGQAAEGQKVEVAATLARLRPPRSLSDVQRVEVAVAPVTPAITEAGLSEARAVAARILGAPLTLTYGQRQWTMPPALLGSMLDIRRAALPGGGTHLVASLNEAKVAAYVRNLAAEIDQPVVDAKLRWTGSGVVVTRESRDGLKLDQAAAVRAILAQATQDHREVTLTANVVKPAVSSEQAPQLGIKEHLATGSSKFAGSSPERVNNIQVAAARLNGTVIPAGATFSFLTSLGPITKENGYKEGLTIVGDETVPGIGGGVCQVSTTLFRAAFFAGLPIVERHQHTYRVGYYEQDGSPVGFDAAVYDPGVDLRFKNDTGAAILIESVVDPGASTISFRLYGTGTGREVKLAASKANEVKAGPRLPDVPDPTLPRGVRKQVEWKADGVDATIRRTVLQGGQVLFTDSFFSRYAPWQEKWVVGTGPTA